MAGKTGSPKRERLTRERILEKAIEIVDLNGLKALTMRRLGAEFGVEAMALYHHFPNKDAILAGVVDRVVLEAGDLGFDEDWKQMMRDGIGLVHRAVAAHPNTAPLFSSNMPPEIAKMVWTEGPMSVLAMGGFEGQALADALHVITAYAMGWQLLAASQGEHSWSGPDGDSGIELPPGLAEKIADWSVGFEVGLDMLLDGLEARYLSGAASKPEN
jgi:AcrR family transcriptional regulator